MIKSLPNKTDFTKTYDDISKNTLQFENSCTVTRFTDSGDTSRLDTMIWDNELMTTYLPSIIENAYTLTFNGQVNPSRYYYNPQALSIDYTGISDYWFIILAMNGYKSRFEFSGFTSMLLMPNVTYINTLLTKIEREQNSRV